MDESTAAALRIRKRLVLLALGLLAVAELLAVVGIGGGPHVLLRSFVRHGHGFLNGTLLAAAVTYAGVAPSRKSRSLALALGLVFQLAHVAVLQNPETALLNFGGGFGIGAVVVAGVDASRTRDEASLLRLFEVALFPLYALVAYLPLDLTVLLHPHSLDAALLTLDRRVFGESPAFVVGRAFAENELLRLPAALVTGALPVLLALVHLRERGAGRNGDLQVAWFVAGLAVLVLHHLAPATGPGSYWPTYLRDVPAVERLFASPEIGGTRYRQGVPSLAATSLLLAYWHARSLGRALQIGVVVVGLVTIAAMLGLGEHYLIDLLITVPFAVAVRAALARRPRMFAGAAAIFAVWLVVLRAPPALLQSALALRVLTIVSTAVAIVLERRMRPVVASPALVVSTRLTRRARIIVAIFFASGFAGLLYEVVFAKALALVFGSTAVASTTVLATYMGGMALGSYVGGRIKVRSALRAYAACELGIGASCALSPVIVKLVRSAYVALASGGDPGRPSIVVLQVALGALVLLPPTVLMGMTLPILARYFERDDPTLGRSVAVLYAANTAGAAAGALLAGYLLLPWLGVFGATLVGVVANLVVALGARRLADRTPAAAPAEAPAEEGRAVERAAVGWLGYAVLGVGGLVSLGLEITYNHLLSVVVGNSTYAFSSMLVSFLVGLAGGATVGRRWLRAGRPLAVGIGLAQAGVVAVVLLGVYFWNGVPDYFASYERFDEAKTFPVTEFIRFVVCAGLLIPPAFFVGMSYPISIEAIVRASKRAQERALGNGAATNTIGNISGALVTGFVLVPSLGALRTLHALMLLTACLAGGALVISAGERMRRLLVGALGFSLLLAVLQPRRFDLDRLAAGSNVYFRKHYRGPVIDSVESLEGGLTTVCRGEGPDGPVKTLLTNGKFQGDDSLNGEMRAQYGFTLMPLLHSTARGEALVIGFGTGTSTRVVQDAGYARVRVAELSRDIVEMSRRHFGRANGDILDRPNVAVSYTDGRNFLLLQDTKYDFIGVEITSIWFAGAASLYNVEFYELTKKRLTERGGVFQQWIQLHHVDAADVASMLASIRAVYDQVWVYVAGGQGVVVACATDCPPTDEAIAKLDGTPALADGLALLGGSASRLAESRVLIPSDTDRMLTAAGAPPSNRERLMWIASTDDNAFLEYHTPRGNVRPENQSFARNLALLRRFASGPLPALKD